MKSVCVREREREKDKERKRRERERETLLFSLQCYTQQQEILENFTLLTLIALQHQEQRETQLACTASCIYADMLELAPQNMYVCSMYVCVDVCMYVYMHVY
jgi:hypothetical protein